MLAVAACAVALAACSEAASTDAPEPDAGRRSSRPDAGWIPGGEKEDAIAPREPPNEVHTYAPTFDAIHNEIFIPTCAAVFCHLSDDFFFNAISPERAYETLVGAVTTSPECGSTGLERVSPGHPERSLLYLKLTDPPCGRKMPLGFAPQLPEPEIEQIRVWIERGAPRYEADG